MRIEQRVENPDAGRDTMTTEHTLQLFSSLEPPNIAQALQSVCSDLLGPCTTGVFTFMPDDPGRVLRFGKLEDAKPVEAPHIEEGGSFGCPAPIEAAGPDIRPWIALLPLGDPLDRLGILEASFDRPLDGTGRHVLQELARATAVAVRNGLSFERTKRLTFTDDLTTLYNSRFMALYLDREVKRCRRMRSSLSLLFMDLDGFKSVNDTYGHLAGSRTLVEVGAALEKTVRDADVLIRYGGDEFVILFPETPLSGGLIIAERIRQVIAGTKFLESQQLDARVSASIGLAAYPETADDVRGLIASADRAMYAAKALGKNRVVAASPLSSPNP